jgi:glycosyltransferase involved in cell wall biosynthesis
MALLREFLALPDRFVALTPWVRDLLIANGVCADRIVLSKHGWTGQTRASSRRGRGGLRIAHLGRLDPVKGTGLLVRAVREVTTPVELDIFGVVQGPEDVSRLASLREMSAGDPRIRFLPRLEPRSVVEALSDYDVLAVPSQWLETGPLVVLEAFAAGVPVLGSDLGGIAEKVRHGVDGVLVNPHGSQDAWRAAIEELAADPGRVQLLKSGVRPPRPADVVADEMQALYSSLVAARSAAFRAAV